MDNFSPGPGGSILLVDDDPLIRSFAGELLRNCGYAVREAPSGEDALRLAGDGSPAPVLLITDMDMKGMDGRALADALRLRLPGLKVLVISGRGRDELARRLPGDVALLPKPFRGAILLAVVKVLLG